MILTRVNFTIRGVHPLYEGGWALLEEDETGHYAHHLSTSGIITRQARGHLTSVYRRNERVYSLGENRYLDCTFSRSPEIEEAARVPPDSPIGILAFRNITTCPTDDFWYGQLQLAVQLLGVPAGRFAVGLLSQGKRRIFTLPEGFGTSNTKQGTFNAHFVHPSQDELTILVRWGRDICIFDNPLD